MNLNILTYNFIGFWEIPLQTVPVFETEYLMSIFNSPASTKYIYNADSVTLRITNNNGVYITQAITISQTHLQITGLSAEEVLQIKNKIESKLRSYFPKLDFTFANYSVVFEYEITSLENNYNEWASKVFFTNINRNDVPSFKLVPNAVSFSIESETGHFMFYLEPRATNNEFAYARISKQELETLKQDTFDSILKEKYVIAKENIEKQFIKILPK